VRLLVVPLLQAILDAAQVTIRRTQLDDRRGGQQLLTGKQRQRREQTAGLQPRIAATADQLVCLYDEFDLTYAARTSLMLSLSSRRSTSRAISSFIARSESNTPKSR
jgi:hypothetical protein